MHPLLRQGHRDGLDDQQRLQWHPRLQHQEGLARPVPLWRGLHYMAEAAGGRLGAAADSLLEADSFHEGDSLLEGGNRENTAGASYTGPVDMVDKGTVPDRAAFHTDEERKAGPRLVAGNCKGPPMADRSPRRCWSLECELEEAMTMETGYCCRCCCIGAARCSARKAHHRR